MNVFEQIGDSLRRAGFPVEPTPTGQYTPAAQRTGLDDAVTSLRYVAPSGEAAAMIRELAELAKLGYTAEQLRTLVAAAEQSHIIAFQWGRIIHLGKATHESL